MAYSTSTPPGLIAGGFAGGTETTGRVQKIWSYVSADALATVIAANYISNAQDLGMEVGDMVMILDTTNDLQHIARVSAVASTGSTMVTMNASST